MNRLYVVTFRKSNYQRSDDERSFIVTANTRRSAVRSAYAKLRDPMGHWLVHAIRPATAVDRAAWEKANA